MHDRSAEILSQYDDRKDVLKKFCSEIESHIDNRLTDKGIKFTIASRVKTRKSLEGKLERKLKKGKYYQDLSELTDVVGVRVITYFSDDADSVARLIRQRFSIDWLNSEDKRDRLKAEEFGYRSDHYVIAFTGDLCCNHGYARFAGFKAELQVRTFLQHVLAEIEHDDLGYGSPVMVSREVRRRLARVAASLEGIDEELMRIKTLKRNPLPLVRAEGLTELIEEFEFSLDPQALKSGTDLVLFANTNLTISKGEERETLLVVEDSAQSLPIRGIASNDRNKAYAVVFPGAFPNHLASDLRHVRCRVRGLRVNANQLGASSILVPTQITVAVTASLESMDVLSHFPVANIMPGLLAKLWVDSRVESTLVGWRVSLQVSEGFAGAFKSAAQETGSDRAAKPGTRLMAQFANVPQSCEVWVSAANVTPPYIKAPEPALSARYVLTDPNGAGRREPTGKDLSPGREVLEQGTPIALIEIPTWNGSGIAVWEISDETKEADCPRTMKFYAYLRADVASSIDIECSMSFAPLSSVGTPSFTDPQPRFAPGASRRRIRLDI